jgi:hypothetical protein
VYKSLIKIEIYNKQSNESLVITSTSIKMAVAIGLSRYGLNSESIYTSINKYNKFIDETYIDIMTDEDFKIKTNIVVPEIPVAIMPHKMVMNECMDSFVSYIEFDYAKNYFVKRSTVLKKLFFDEVQLFGFYNDHMKSLGFFTPAYALLNVTYDFKDIIFISTNEALQKTLASIGNKINAMCEKTEIAKRLIDYYETNLKKYTKYTKINKGSIFAKFDDISILEAVTIGNPENVDEVIKFADINYGGLKIVSCVGEYYVQSKLEVDDIKIIFSGDAISNKMKFKISFGDKYFIIDRTSFYNYFDTNMTSMDYFNYTEKLYNICSRKWDVRFYIDEFLEDINFYVKTNNCMGVNLQSVLFGGFYGNNGGNPHVNKIIFDRQDIFLKSEYVKDTALAYAGDILVTHYDLHSKHAKIVVTTDTSFGALGNPNKMMIYNDKKIEFELTVNGDGKMLIATSEKDKYLKDGYLLGYKFASTTQDKQYDCVVKLKIPFSATVGTYTYHKYRTNEALVDEIFVPKFGLCHECTKLTPFFDEKSGKFLCCNHGKNFILVPSVQLKYCYSSNDSKFMYGAGAVVKEKIIAIDYDCHKGIHFCINYLDLLNVVGKVKQHDSTTILELPADQIKEIVLVNKPIDELRHELGPHAPAIAGAGIAGAGVGVELVSLMDVNVAPETGVYDVSHETENLIKNSQREVQAQNRGFAHKFFSLFGKSKRE